MEKFESGIRDKHPGSATLSNIYVKSVLYGTALFYLFNYLVHAFAGEFSNPIFYTGNMQAEHLR
jgi:hypothetical protein